MNLLNNSFIVVGFPIALIAVGVYYYNKGLRQSGHHCMPEKVIIVAQGSRYDPQLLEYVTIECNECEEEIQAEVCVSHTFKERAKNRPYAVELRYEDVDAHMLSHKKDTDNTE